MSVKLKLTFSANVDFYPSYTVKIAAALLKEFNVSPDLWIYGNANLNLDVTFTDVQTVNISELIHNYKRCILKALNPPASSYLVLTVIARSIELHVPSVTKIIMDDKLSAGHNLLKLFGTDFHNLQKVADLNSTIVVDIKDHVKANVLSMCLLSNCMFKVENIENLKWLNLFYDTDRDLLAFKAALIENGFSQLAKI